MFNNKFTKKDPVADVVSQIIGESWDDDDEDDDVRRADAELKRMKAKPIEADKKTDPDKEIGKLAKKTPKEVDESVEQIDEISRDLATRYIRKTKPEFSSPAENKKREAGRSLALKKVWGDKKYGLPEPKVKATEEVEVNEDKWTDIADGPWKRSNRSKSSAVSAAANAAGKGLKGAQHKLDVAKPKGKLTGADFKKLRKEDAEQIDELSAEKLISYRKKAYKQYDKAFDENPRTAPMNRITGAETADEKIKKKTGSYFPSPAKRIAAKLRGEEVEIQEKTLTPAESKKKEEIVKSMKKDKAGFKERYGKRAKEVMYATATKTAKKVAEDTEQLDEISKKLAVGYMRANTKRMSSLSNPDSMEKKMKRIDAYDTATKKYHGEKGVKVKATEETVIEELVYEDTATGITIHKKDGEVQVHHKGKQIGSLFTHRGNWGYEHHPSGNSSVGYSKMRHAIDALRDEHAGYKKYMKKSGNVSEAAGPTSTYDSDTFATSANPTSNPITPLQRIKSLAFSAKTRLNDSMMGKAGTTSEEIDPEVKTTDTLRGRIKGGKKDDVGPGSDFKSTKVKFTPGPK